MIPETIPPQTATADQMWTVLAQGIPTGQYGGTCTAATAAWAQMTTERTPAACYHAAATLAACTHGHMHHVPRVLSVLRYAAEMAASNVYDDAIQAMHQASAWHDEAVADPAYAAYAEAHL